MIEQLVGDIRFALRTLAGSKLVTGLAIVCLGLGIGVNAAIFSVVDSALLKPLPFTDASSLVSIATSHPAQGIRRDLVSYPNFLDWQRRTVSFVRLAGAAVRSFTLSDGAEPERLQGAAISWDLFDMIGQQPILGRSFRAEEDRPGAVGVVLLGHDLWLRRYQGDPGVLGRAIVVNDAPHEIVGVMPPRFEFPFGERLWVPLAPVVRDAPRADNILFVYGRLRPGVGLAQATEDVEREAAGLAAEFPDDNEGTSASLEPLSASYLPAEVKLVMLTMMGAVTFVLLIACANVANLLLARATSRQRELAIRTALGAGRGRIMALILTESVVLALASLPLGIGLAYVGIDLINGIIPPDSNVPYVFYWSLDTRVLAYSVAVAAFTGILFGLVPALQAGQRSLTQVLKAGSRGAGASAERNGARTVLVVGEVAAALVLLVGASLFVRTFFNLDAANTGFDTRPLVAMRFYMPGERYASDEAIAQRVEDVVARIEALPGVQSATASNLIPLSGGGAGGSMRIEGRPVERGREPRILYAGVTPRFFDTLGVSLTRGRTFTDLEGRTLSAVAVVNRTLASTHWPDEDPTGRRFQLVDGRTNPTFTIIGVVPDVLNDDLEPDEPPESSAYVPYPYLATRNTGIVIRAEGDPTRLAGPAREAIRAADPGLPVFAVNSMDEVKRQGFWQFLVFGQIFSTLGAIALVLALVGVYGVLSYGVSQRLHEFGVRMALGASPRDLLGLVLRHGFKLAVVGIVIGFVMAQIVARLIRSLLFGVGGLDPVSFGLVPVLLVGTALLASYLPARRATATDPVVALREE